MQERETLPLGIFVSIYERFSGSVLKFNSKAFLTFVT
jgi:hypothetical protein